MSCSLSRAVLFVLAAGAMRCAVLYTDSPRFGRAAPKVEEFRPVPVVRRAVPRGRQELPWPAAGPIVGAFGTRSDPKYKTVTRSQGIEIATSPGSPVTAVDSGRVSFADVFMGHGRMVIVDHGRRLHSLYSRLGDIKVSIGERVSRGQAIGITSDTLHFEFRVGGRSVDPLEWLQPHR